MSANPFDLTGKVALVTGGNSGLGLGFATAIAEAGADVVIWGRRAEANQAAVDELKAHGGRVSSQQVDVSDEAQVTDGIAQAVAEMGRLDCVVANAGISTPKPSFLELDTPHYRELLATNLDGGFFALREGARHMVERAEAGDPGGSLLVCGSLSPFMGIPGMQHYAAAKGGLLAMMRGLAVELGPYEIRANMVAPGYFVTPLGTSRQTAERKALDERFASRTPLGRNGTPEDLGGIAVYLMSDRATFHTGDVIVIDGGISLNLF